MDAGTFKEINAKITPDASVPTSIILGKEGYVAVPLGIEHFHAITPAEKMLAFVDSGNAELAKGANFSLQFIRTCAVIKGKAAIHREHTCLVQASRKDGKLGYSIELFGTSKNLPFIDLYDQSLALGSNRVEPARVAELVRTLLELQLATDIIKDLPNNSFLVRDGSLEAHTIHEQNALRALYEAARLQGVTIAGLSKTSTLLTDTGHAAVPFIAHLAPQGRWAYHPIATSNRPEHQAIVCIAKLHERSTHSFRIDVFDQNAPFVDELLSALAFESQDAAFLGYPYGLTEVDRYAKVREEERAYLRMRAEAALGHSLQDAERAIDAHDRLNEAV